MGKKELLAQARMMRPRVYIGRNGATPGAVRALREAFAGHCLDPRPAECVKVRVQRTFPGDPHALAADLAERAGCSCIRSEAGGKFLFFAKP